MLVIGNHLYHSLGRVVHFQQPRGFLQFPLFTVRFDHTLPDPPSTKDSELYILTILFLTYRTHFYEIHKGKKRQLTFDEKEHSIKPIQTVFCENLLLIA